MGKLTALVLLAAGLAGAQYLPPPARAFVTTVNSGTDVVCALHADVITGLTCQPTTDGTTATAFASTVTIPAGTLNANVTKFNLNLGYVSSGTAPTIAFSVKLGSTVVYTSNSMNTNSLNTVVLLSCNLVAAAAASATTPVVAGCSGAAFSNATRNTLLSTTTKSIAVDTTVAQTLSVTVIFGANTAGNAAWLYSISQ